MIQQVDEPTSHVKVGTDRTGFVVDDSLIRWDKGDAVVK